MLEKVDEILFLNSKFENGTEPLEPLKIVNLQRNLDNPLRLRIRQMAANPAELESVSKLSILVSCIISKLHDL